MKLAIANSVYTVPSTGVPVEGRMYVFVHDTDTPADIWTLDNADYVPARNPQLLHGGLPEHTLFTETGIYDILVQRYIGEPGMMSVNSPDTDFEDSGDYETGLDFDLDSLSDNVVDTVDDLRDAAPELGTVTVNWYASPGDCVRRTYVWDAASQDQEDGGYVIGSNTTDTGNWILMWDDEILPACVYGVQPGDEANIPLLLGYASTVGSFALRTAPCVRFQRGTWTSSVDFSTNKELCFDAGAKFLYTAFTCPKARVFGRVTDYVADFSFTSQDAEAHSCWFRSAIGFWTCGAKVLTVDSTNFMSDLEIRGTVTVSSAVILACGQIAATYDTGACIRLENVVVEGKPFRMASDFVALSGNGYGDRIFTGAASSWDPGLVSDGHHVQFSTAPGINEFDSARLWYEVMKERRERAPLITTDTLDFENRQMSGSVDMGSFAVLRNVRTESVRVSAQYATLENVKADLYVDSDSTSSVLINDSEITIYSWDGLINLGGNRSNLTIAGNTGIDPTDCAITWNGGNFEGKIWMSDANADTYAKAKLVSFNEVKFTQQWNWRTNYLAMRSCFGGVKVDLLPYASGSDYLYDVTLIDNIFAGSTRFWFTMYGTDQSPHTEIAGHAKFGNACITGNQWRGSDAHPIKMLRWHPFWFTQFIADDPGNWEYTANTGNCPLLKPEAIVNGAGVWGEAETGPDAIYCYMNLTPVYMWCPRFHYAGTAIDYMYASEKPGQLVRLGIQEESVPSFSNCLNAIGVLKAGQTQPADLMDEDLNNMFIVYYGIAYGAPIGAKTQGHTFWPENWAC